MSLFGRLQFTVVFIRPLDILNHFGSQGKNHFEQGMENDGGQHPVIVTGGSIAMMIFTAMLAMDFMGMKQTRAVNGEEIVIIPIAIIF